jgi:hypothetical protein
MKFTGENQSTRGKPCPTANLSTTNSTWTGPGSNPGLRGERPATNRLSHVTAPDTITIADSFPFLSNALYLTCFCPQNMAVNF